MLTGEQIRAARALLRWGQTELAENSGISLETIKRLEGMRGEVGAHTATVSAIEGALKAAGIEILSNGGPGVRLKE